MIVEIIITYALITILGYVLLQVCNAILLLNGIDKSDLASHMLNKTGIIVRVSVRIFGYMVIGFPFVIVFGIILLVWGYR